MRCKEIIYQLELDLWDNVIDGVYYIFFIMSYPIYYILSLSYIILSLKSQDAYYLSSNKIYCIFICLDNIKINNSHYVEK